jgi:transcription elongation factor GreA
MSDQKSPMTPAGFKAIQEELKILKTVERPKNVKDIEVARAQGDLSENADYDAAKERQAFISARMGVLEHKIATAQVIDPSKLDHDKVVFGAKIKLSDTESGEEISYQIVGTDEADIKQGLLSVASPIARSLIGKSEGDVAAVLTPSGKKEFEILEIIYE